MPLLQRGEVATLVVRCSVNPASPENADPLEGQGADGGVVRGALASVLLIERLGPEGGHERLLGPLDEGLTSKGRTSSTPVYDGGGAAALGDRRDANVLLDSGRARKTFAAFAKGHE